MKNILFIFLFSFSFSCFAEWEYVTESDEDIYHIDFKKIRKEDGFYYFRVLTDLAAQDEIGNFSYKYFIKGDCALYRFKILSISFYKEKMGEGYIDTDYRYKFEDWSEPEDDSVMGIMLKSVCRNSNDFYVFFNPELMSNLNKKFMFNLD